MPEASALKVVIVGGGVIGCACGHYLSRAGADVTIVERRFLACGASGANAGIIGIGLIDPPALARLFAESRRLLAELVEEIDDFEHTNGGTLFVGLDEADAEELKRSFERYRAAGLECELLSPEEMVRREPLATPAASAGLFAAISAHVNPFLLTHALARSVVRMGGKVLTGVTVRSIDTDGSGLAVATSEGRMSADAVVLASGWQASELLEPLGIVLPVAPARGQIIISEPLAPMTRKIIVSCHDIYARQTADGTFQIGSHTELVGPRKDVTLAKLRAYTDGVTRIVPFFKNVRMLRAYAGLRPLCADARPIVCPAPGRPGLVLACGHSRTGVNLAPVTGRIVCELVREGCSSLDISPWDLARFGGKGFEECYDAP